MKRLDGAQTTWDVAGVRPARAAAVSLLILALIVAMIGAAKGPPAQAGGPLLRVQHSRSRSGSES